MESLSADLPKNETILALKNQEKLTENSLTIARLAQTTKEDNDVMTRMVHETRRESRTMRIVTIVATFYLPANLVTVRPFHYGFHSGKMSRLT
jgi:hypothetical protein